MRIKYLIVICLIFTSCIHHTTRPVTKHGQLWVDGTKLRGENGEVVILKGISLGWHNWYFRFYNKYTIKWLRKKMNCSVIRLAVGVETDHGYLRSPDWSMNILNPIIQEAIKENIYIIIDWHSHNINLNEAKVFFTRIAKLYGKYPNILYELFNEPDYESWSDIKAYSTELIEVIRKIDSNNIILVGTPNWSQNIDTAAEDPIQGYNNVMYTLHFYAASHTEWLRNKVNYAVNKGLPIFVSECSGTQADGNGDINLYQYKEWLRILKKEQISWVVWSLSDKNESSALLKPGSESFGRWKTKDLTESGKLVRSLLKNSY